MSEQSLVIVPPLEITDAMLTATDVPEADYAAWNAATAYVIGDRVIRTGVHEIYERVVAGTTATAPEADAVNWLKVSPTNRWKLFDRRNSSRTAQANAFYYRITPGQAIGAQYLGDLVDCDTVRIRMTDPVYGLVYDSGLVSVGALPLSADWHSFLLGNWSSGQRLYTVADLPSFPNAELRVDFAGGPALAVGVLLLGTAFEFGLGVQRGIRTGIQDYSQNTRNKFGDMDFVEGAYAKTVRITVRVLNSELDTLQDFLTDLRAQPALYIGYGPLGVTHVYGRYLSFENVISYARESDCELQLEGLT
ncbi:carbohydrate-binding protein [Aquabacterium sp.]|uniref:carbohydrate-binding protein n=1 Tax=Aquabacterium sp. TaxID=1872578 RepID=UPI0025B9ABDF|nr:carbohydrate-binding protein [Aquabacterium sp.]